MVASKLISMLGILIFTLLLSLIIAINVSRGFGNLEAMIHLTTIYNDCPSKPHRKQQCHSVNIKSPI